MDNTGIHDIFVIGNRIDGGGIARDAVGRGCRVVLAQPHDLDGPATGAPQLSMEQKNA